MNRAVMRGGSRFHAIFGAFATAFALAPVLLLAQQPGETPAPKQKLRLTYPNQIGDLAFKEVRPPSEHDRSTQLLYKAPGIVLTIYIYGGGPDLPDGVDSPGLTREFETAKQAIHDPRAWKKAKDVSDGTVQLGKEPHLVPAREGVFKVKSDHGKANSYLYLSASHHVYFKARCTASDLKEDVEQKNLGAIRIAVGEMIHSAFDVPPEPVEPNPAEPPPAAPAAPDAPPATDAAGPVSLAGTTWTGTSTCVGDRPACRNEVVVYRFVPVEGEDSKVRLLADKVLDGKRVTMGALDFTVQGARLTSEFQVNETHGLWEFTVSGDTMEGSLVLLPGREPGRRVAVHRVADDTVPAAPPVEDYFVFPAPPSKG